MRSWSLLTLHGQTLLLLASSPRLRVHDLAERLGVTERAVMRLLADLEASGHLRRKREGRRNLYAVEQTRSSPDSADLGLTVGDLLHGRKT